ncbi:MAG TPA: glutamine--tRNA ligase/YqeY domain fusion protein [Thermotogota bacterium]|nr:glutamine--tRNA ligase/YqeY domain fusion protein [Thermotogota bacterium]HOZ12858.1 glutamine--tRNA ligase/YqeY domain fusion protein [Thermotogota bacterium]HPM21776.1 glutamine--tRNA ligase/YqeY domain fusion protein [Thermotogota bacterium]
MEQSNMNFIEKIIDEDLKSGRIQQVVTRFPPEPNGYLHIGHAKAVTLNHGFAKTFGGRFNLRFDDTNPEKEEEEFMQAIMDDVQWLGCQWDELRYASDYFDQFYEWALELIRSGKAYVDDQSPEEIRISRGTLTEPGKDSPFRSRTIEENLRLFEEMRTGQKEEESCVLRAKIDMSHPNMNMRDPILYRIVKKPHYRTKDKWCLYPMYDFAQGYEDAIEGVTHSVCSLEFEDHRPLYDWLIENVSVPCHPHQYEFARLNISNTVMSKRILRELVNTGIVSGWDDPRMPTLRGLRRRGFTPSAIRKFLAETGLAKSYSIVDYEFLESVIRDEMNAKAQRALVVLKPIKVLIENYPTDRVEWLEAENNPEDPSAGARQIPFSREIYIEEEDFMENPPKKYFRLSPGAEVRLKYAYYITCREVVKDTTGKIVELRCVYDPESKGGGTPDGRRVKGTLHWVSAAHAVKAEVRLYDKLFTLRDMNMMEAGKSYKDYLNPDSCVIIQNALAEPMLSDVAPGTSYQFLRQGYFGADQDSRNGKPVFNRTVTLKDSWAKIQDKA